MKIENDYINKINVLALILISIYCISNVGHTIDSSHKLIYNLTRLVTNLGFPLLLMTFGAAMLKKHENPIGFVKETYKSILPSFIIWNIILGILILYYDGFHSFIPTIAKTNWFLWIILSNVLVVPILSEFISFEKESGIKYILALFFISSILLSLSVQFHFRLYYIDLVFFAEPLAFMVLGYYLDNKEFKFNSTRIFLISSIILVITLFLRVLLVTSATTSWTAFFINIYGTTFHISVDPFTIIEVSSIFLMLKSLKGFLNNNSIINFYSNKTFSFILVLGIFTYLLPKFALKLSWIKLTFVSTILFLIFAGILFFILEKIPFIKRYY